MRFARMFRIMGLILIPRDHHRLCMKNSQRVKHCQEKKIKNLPWSKIIKNISFDSKFRTDDFNFVLRFYTFNSKLKLPEIHFNDETFMNASNRWLLLCAVASSQVHTISIAEK
ncbi:CLUMA_CG019834, isoform A [Clunio marinus]|uniref:CLUMA_CG019834, isoform A n=1 Tax=Clunio marinus TaxID=568069 RepID=A0A1J1J356_9DIPT|nr:CLUMA_CG019834, isoform A [Clunio marinus]